MKRDNIMTIEQTAQLEIVKSMPSILITCYQMHLITFFSTTIETATLVGHGQKLRYFLSFAELN